MQLSDNVQLTQCVSIALYCFTFVFLFNFINHFSDIFLSCTTAKNALYYFKPESWHWAFSCETPNPKLVIVWDIQKRTKGIVGFWGTCQFAITFSWIYNRQWEKISLPHCRIKKGCGDILNWSCQSLLVLEVPICMLLFYFNGGGIFVGLGYLLTLYQL